MLFRKLREKYPIRNDPFVEKYKKNCGLFRKINYQERIKLKNTKQLIPIKDKLSY